VAGLDLSRLGQQVRRIIGVVTHEPLLYDGLTGYENLNFVGRLFGLDRLDERIAAVAALVGVTSRLHQKVGTLSHGLRKRFSLARAVLHDPPVLIMDEPDSGLDQEALALLDTIVTDPAHPYRAVVMTTHSLERGLVLGHRTAILSRGGIAYEAAVDSSSGVDGLRRAYSRYTTTMP
jgi:ABC-type multidrug transport system ATPase subunit